MRRSKGMIDAQLARKGGEFMKKKLLLLILVATIVFGLSGCAGGQQLQAERNTEWHRMLDMFNRGIFVYSFRDEETGVWYISNGDGITPRLNADGNLYVTEPEIEK